MSAILAGLLLGLSTGALGGPMWASWGFGVLGFWIMLGYPTKPPS